MLYELKKQRQAGCFLSGSVCGKTSPAAINTAITKAKGWLIVQINAGRRLRRAQSAEGWLNGGRVKSATSLWGYLKYCLYAFSRDQHIE
jgi:hypothetical protein